MTEPLHQIRNQSNRCVVKLWTTNHLLNFIPRDWLLTHSLEWSLQYREIFGIQHLATRPSLGQERFCGWTTMEAWNNLT